MDESEGKKQFQEDVFPCELEEIRKRREQLDLPDIPPGQAPSADLGIVGLSLSGGGLRSATFSFGIIQALAKHGLLRTVDYLSTVSGGGFIGACLSSVLNSRGVGPEQDRFPLHYQVGAEEPLGVGHLRNSAQYLAPGGFLHKFRIPARVLLGVLSSLLIYLLIIFVAVLATEVVFEVGQRLRLSIKQGVLGVLSVYLILVVAFPAIARWLRGGSTWSQRNFWDSAFTVALLLALFAVLLIPAFILVEQAIDRSWDEVKSSITANMLRPFEERNYIHWLMLFGVLVVFMLAGRASAQVSRMGGKIALVVIGLLGPAVLGTIYLALVVLEIDSPFITPDKLFSIDPEYAEELRDGRIGSDLRSTLADNQIRLTSRAQVITLQDNLEWLIRDYEGTLRLVRDPNELSVYGDFLDALSRGKIPPRLIPTMEKKGYIVDPITLSAPKLRGDRFEISGANRYWVSYDEADGQWSLEQIVNPDLLVAVLQGASYDLRISDAYSGTLFRENSLLLSDGDRELAVRFVGEQTPHDVVVVIDDSKPAFAKPEEFRRNFRAAVEQAVRGIRPEVRMAVLLFEEDVRQAVGFTALTRENKQVLIQRLYQKGDDTAPQLDFEGQLSNTPAALVRALRDLVEKGRLRAKKSILLISDGIIDVDGDGHDKDLEHWITNEFAEDAAAAGIAVYGIALSEKAIFGLFEALTRKTGGAFYPVFEAREGVTFETVLGAMRKLEESTGGRLMTPIRQLSITDRQDGTRYRLRRSENGVRIHVDLPAETLSPDDLTELTDRVRDVFEAQTIYLTDAATIRQVDDGRWEVSDPFQYMISRSGRKLKIEPLETEEDPGVIRLFETMFSSLWDDRADWVFFAVFLILVAYWLTVDVNQTAGHFFYRDRLSKAYLFRIARNGTLEHNDQQKLSELNTQGSAAPYHLINVALNLQGTNDSGLRGRSSDFFIFSKCYTGSTRTGFLKTRRMQRYDGNLNLGTAMAISGAAAAPNMGTTTLKPLILIMILLNLRLGYWLPNPRMVTDASWLGRLALRRGPGPKYVLKEALGHVHGRGRYVYVSDGGSLENLGIYELLRRRCRFIVAVDGEADPDMRFNSLVKLQLYARLDMGIEVELDLDPLRKDAEGLSKRRWVLGTIRYGGGEVGHLLYIKAAVTGEEYEYVRAYRAQSEDFPHESSGGQFFTEAQFEAYRALGYQIGDELFADDQAFGEFRHLWVPGPSTSEKGSPDPMEQEPPASPGSVYVDAHVEDQEDRAQKRVQEQTQGD